MTTTHSTYDFQDIIDNLIVYMKGQSEFADYNYDGAGIKEILRLLAYNTQQYSFENNFLFNELSFDGATIRSNVTSLASVLGYLPTGRVAAKIRVNITVSPPDSETAGSTLTLKRDSRFFANKDGIALNFSPDKEYNVPLVNGFYTFSDVTLLQGVWNSNSFLVQTVFGTESYTIPNNNVDISTMKVAVLDSTSSTAYQTYNLFQSAYDLGPSNQVFFMKENRDSLYEIEFGDDRIAKKLAFGNVVFCEYLTTSGENGNGINKLTPASGVSGYFDVSVEVIDGERSYGGSEPESISDIKALAPMVFASSGNAVTDPDYVAITKRLFTEAGDVIAWGGELNSPPKYGYTFVAVKPKSAEQLTSQQKTDLFDTLMKHNVGAITPIIVDPDYTYINLDSDIKFNPKATVLDDNTLKIKSIDSCRAFSEDKLEKFDCDFNMSKLVEFINAMDNSIRGNSTLVTYEKRFVPELNATGSYIVNMRHSLEPSTIKIDGFTVSDANIGFSYYIEDSNGVLVLKRQKDTTISVVQSNVGVVDYTNGKIDILNFRPNTIIGSYVKVVSSPKNNEDYSVKGVKDSILKINDVIIELESVDG